MNRKKIIGIGLAIFVILVLGAFYFLKFQNKPVEKEIKKQEKNYFEINDELIGVTFWVGKKFERISAQQLQLKNPSFVYGFSAKDDASVGCFVSQTKREREGQVTVGNLRDGVFSQLQKIDADAKIDSAEVIEIGENSNKGAKLEMSYTDGEKIPTLQWEVVGITAKIATFAFCTSPKAVLDLYKEDFNLFLDSVRIE
ncbi:MAG: hypothetical protein WC678_00205 [Parcubacteria group bacterium]|jgi:hypothetical protein